MSEQWAPRAAGSMAGRPQGGLQDVFNDDEGDHVGYVVSGEDAADRAVVDSCLGSKCSEAQSLGVERLAECVGDLLTDVRVRGGVVVQRVRVPGVAGGPGVRGVDGMARHGSESADSRCGFGVATRVHSSGCSRRPSRVVNIYTASASVGHEIHSGSEVFTLRSTVGGGSWLETRAPRAHRGVAASPSTRCPAQSLRGTR